MTFQDYNFNNYTSFNNNWNGNFANPMIGASSFNNSLWPQAASNDANYYNRMLGMTTPNLSQSLSNISINPYASSQSSMASITQDFWNNYLASFSKQESQEEEPPVETSEQEGNKNLIDIANSQLGKKESDGSYHKFTKGHDVPWCAAFVTWCLKKDGTSVKGGTANWSCDELAKNLLEEKPDALAFDRKQGLTDESQIKPGAVIFFSDNHTSKDYTHVGIVDKVENGKIYTTEGNTGDKVGKRSYSIDDKYIQTVVNYA